MHLSAFPDRRKSNPCSIAQGICDGKSLPQRDSVGGLGAYFLSAGRFSLNSLSAPRALKELPPVHIVIATFRPFRPA